MASSTIVPYKSNAATETFALVSQNQNGATYKVASRELALPYSVEVQRKLTPSNSTANDHISVRLARVERNATTGKLATCQILLDISIPKDTTVLTQTVQKEMLACVASLLNEETAMEATNVNITALLSGGDL